jgi:hypothetical protein
MVVIIKQGQAMTLRTLSILLLILTSEPAFSADKAPKIPKQVQQLLNMTPEDFSAKITIKDDSLETSAEISTVNGWQQKDGLLKIVNSDQFFRAFVNKRSGVVTYQVYQYVYYYGDWAFFNLVNFETPDGPVQKDLTVISRDVLECSRYLGCRHVEHLAFDVDEGLLRAAAANYKPGQLAAWRFRLKAKSGVQRDEGFVAAEIIALLQAVDKYKASHGLTMTQ